jgi:penicillin amidase
MQHDAHNTGAARDVALFQGWTSNDRDVERARAQLAAWNGEFRWPSTAAALYDRVSDSIPDEARRSGATARERAALIEPAIRYAVRDLRDDFGDDPSQWRWGHIHRSEFPHALVQAYDIPAIERDGGSGTVAATGATYRQVIDFANLDASAATNVPGQSAQPGSPFYANLTATFARGEYFPLAYSRAAVERNRAHRLLLTPRR